MDQDGGLEPWCGVGGNVPISLEMQRRAVERAAGAKRVSDRWGCTSQLGGCSDCVEKKMIELDTT